ncbi:MAG: polyphosphate kinase 1 [Candidatus Rariloculaceae bacterium]
MDTANLLLPEYYINRELSRLEFNVRVLNQAKNADLPLFERLKFLCICSTNLDELFEIRVSNLKQRLEVSSAPSGPDNMSPAEVLKMISERAHELVAEQYRVLNHDLIPTLHGEGICFIQPTEWSEQQREWLHNYFRTEIVPVLSPTTIDPTRPIPRILNKSLNFIVSLRGRDAFKRPVQRAILQAPRSLPRLIRLPAELNDTGETDFVFLSSIIHAFVDELFAGLTIEGCYQFRATRNSELYVDNEEVGNLMRALEGELFESRYGAAVRLEIFHDCPDDLAEFLLDHFKLSRQDLYKVQGPVNLNRILTAYDLVDRPDLKDPAYTPGIPKRLEKTNPFVAILKGDILLHHPFDSFGPVMEFVYQAANDPNVVAIKQTLYRTTPDSPLVGSLISAAKAGKEVTVMIELRARFDEAANIELANNLQDAGAHVVYGVAGYKTHCKMLLVVRREEGELRRYAHLSTGNYHPGTARNYTDYGLFTADEDLGHDIHEVFMHITSLTKTADLKKIYQSPFSLHEKLLKLIRRESATAAAGGNGHIVAKVNALVEPEIIRALYEASISGVLVDLIVRSICCLRPGIPGVSDNIRVRSIVGRFLEHDRTYYFHNDGKEEVYCASADWMDRNFFSRIEIMYPILDKKIKKRLMRNLDIYLADNVNAWELVADGTYRRIGPEDRVAEFCAQEFLLNENSN